jgi:hypothetical protein
MLHLLPCIAFFINSANQKIAIKGDQMKKAALLFILLSIAIFYSDAMAISIDEFIATASDDYTLDFQNEKIAFLRSSSSNTPFINEIELRTQTDEFDPDRQRYRVRVQPNGLGEARYGKKVYYTTLQYNEAQYDLLLNDALRNRYVTVINLLYNKAHLELMRKLMVLQEDKINVLRKSVNNLDFDARDLIDAEDDVIKLQVDMISLEEEIIILEDEIRKNIPTDGPIELDISNMVDHKFIESFVTKLDTESPDNVHLRNAELSSRLSSERLELERAENKRYISYFEATYDMADRDELDKALSLEFGITIPIVNPNRLDINRRKMTSLRDKRRFIDQQRVTAYDISKTLRDIKRLLKQYEVLTQKKEASKAESSLKTYMKVEGVDPLILLKLRESMLKTEIALEKINNRIYAEYIKLLDVTGTLIEKPITNYLSINMEQIGE